MDTPIIIGLLVIAGVWSVYLFPSLAGDRRNAPMSSTEEFDRWTHLMADVRKPPPSRGQVGRRDTVRLRRRRTFVALIALALGGGLMAWSQGSLAWLSVHLFFDSLILLYVAAISQMRKRRDWRLQVSHVSDQRTDWEESQIRVIAN